MSFTLVDAAWQRPTPQQARAAGHRGIIGYISDYPSKNITKAECDAYIADKQRVVLVWEDTARDGYGTYADGVAAGQKAGRQALALGCPKGVVLWFASDSNASTVASVTPYLTGCRDGAAKIGFLAGGYGDAAAARVLKYGWHVETWGTADANMTQEVNHVDGHIPGTDTDLVTHDFPCWGGFVPVIPAPVSPKPKPTPAPFAYPPSETRVGFTGHIINWRLKAALEAAERRWGHEFVVIKGCFLPVDAASGSTHHGSGVCDILVYGDPNLQVASLRAVGVIAWHRTVAQGFAEEHLHCALEGDPGLDPEAAAQVSAYHNHENGLANHGPDDSPEPQHTVFTYPPKA